MSSMCLNISSKTWMPLPRFIDEHLMKVFTLFDQAPLQLIEVTNPAAITRARAFSTKSYSLAPCPYSCLNILIKMQYSAENAMFIVYINCLRDVSTQRHFRTTDCSNLCCMETEIFCYRYSKVFSSEIWWFFLIYIQETSAPIFVMMRSDSLFFIVHNV